MAHYKQNNNNNNTSKIIIIIISIKKNNNNNNIVALTKVYCECFKKFFKNTNLIKIYLLRVSKNLKDLHDLIYIIYNK